MKTNINSSLQIINVPPFLVTPVAPTMQDSREKKEHAPLPSNFSTCQGRIPSMARRLSRTPNLLKTYGDILTDYEARNFIERVNAAQPSDHTHFTFLTILLCHPKESSTTPVRIVFDWSCHQNPNSPSLTTASMLDHHFEMTYVLLSCDFEHTPMDSRPTSKRPSYM